MAAWELLSTTTASNDATIDITNLSSTHFVFKFIWYGLDPVTDGAEFFMRTDSDNGASFDAGTSDYGWVHHHVEMDPTTPAHAVTGDNADSEIQLFVNHGSAANELGDIEITLFNPSGTEFTKVKWKGLYFNSALSRYAHVMGAGVRLSAANVDAVRFLYSTGNINAGTLKVYGIKA